MPNKRPTKLKETQHYKFVRFAHESGADESAFVSKVKAIYSIKQKPKKSG